MQAGPIKVHVPFEAREYGIHRQIQIDPGCTPRSAILPGAADPTARIALVRTCHSSADPHGTVTVALEPPHPARDQHCDTEAGSGTHRRFFTKYLPRLPLTFFHPTTRKDKYAANAISSIQSYSLSPSTAPVTNRAHYCRTEATSALPPRAADEPGAADFLDDACGLGARYDALVRRRCARRRPPRLRCPPGSPYRCARRAAFGRGADSWWPRWPPRCRCACGSCAAC